ncbi:MAG: hypothetical protein OEP95_03705 [Myxococcales bacterium]|nr:hypothetical protein [Myxococcales bacterium]
MRAGTVLTLALIVLFGASTASAKSHQWRFTEVFSNAEGNVQFIELFVFDPAGTAEWQLAGEALQSQANTFIFPNDLPMENTFERWFLVATADFATLPGAPTPDYIIPDGFFDPAGDQLRYRWVVDILPFPGGIPTDGLTAYLYDGSTALNSPANFAGVVGSVDVSRPCDDTLDNDGDGYVDLADPACKDASFPREHAQCQDGINNDSQFGTDFDGGESIHGIGFGDPNGPDPYCVGAPWFNREARACGIGFELVVAIPLLVALRRRRAHALRF